MDIEKAQREIEHREVKVNMQDWSVKKKQLYYRLGHDEFFRKLNLAKTFWNSPDGKKAIRKSLNTSKD